MSFAKPAGCLAAIASAGLVLLLLVSGFVAADTHVWTSQTDFQAGTLTNTTAAAVPGSLQLAANASFFAKYSGNPVFTPGAPGSWEETNINYIEVLFDGGIYKMWYAGCVGPYCEIGYATSPDGLVWTRYSGNPVFNSTPGAWDANVGNPRVIHDGSVYKMWFAGDDLAGSIRVGYATSPDGIHWTAYPGNPVLSGNQSWDPGVITAPYVIQSGAGYTMWYGGMDYNRVWRIGRATSPDGTSWTEDSSNPVLAATYPYEGQYVFPMTVFNGTTGYELYYSCGNAGSPGALAHAVSPDGRNWTREPLGLILQGGAYGAWDGNGIGDTRVLQMPTRRVLWYVGYSTYQQVGFAATPGYPPSGTFTSAVFDSGANGTTWNGIQWNGTTPSLTGLAVAARVGPHSTPDATWSPWSPESTNNTNLTLPRSRYFQLQATLTTSNTNATPVLQDATLSYTPDRATAPTLVAPSNLTWTANATTTLGWKFHDPDPGDIQIAYQAQVSSDPTFAVITMDSGAIVSNGTSESIATPGDGTWYWRVRTEDSWGQWSSFSAANTLSVDRTAPTVTTAISGPEVTVGGATFVTSQAVYYLNATDGPQGIGVALVLYSVDGAFRSAYTGPFRINGTDGVHFVRFSALDFLGNIMPNGLLTVSLDDTGPTTALSVTPSSSGYDVTASALDSSSGVKDIYVSVDNAAWSPYAGAVSVDAAGSHTVRAYAVDRLGNVGTTQTVTILIPNLQPYLAGSIGMFGILLGVALSRLRKGGRILPAAIALTFGGLEIAIAATSAGTGMLAIPPWLDLPFIIDVLLGAGIAAAVLLEWKIAARPATSPPPMPPPPGGP